MKSGDTTYKPRMLAHIGGSPFNRRCNVTDKGVYCPNATFMGYSVRDAKPGHWLSWKDQEDGPLEYGRVLGRISSCDSDGEDCTGHIVVLWVHCGLSYGSIRWVDPKDVTECSPPSPQLMAVIMSCKINKTTIETLATSARQGELSENYIDKVIKRLGKEAFDISIKPDRSCKSFGKGLCPICGEKVSIQCHTKDGRIVGSCGDAFTVEQWNWK